MLSESGFKFLYKQRDRQARLLKKWSTYLWMEGLHFLKTENRFCVVDFVAFTFRMFFIEFTSIKWDATRSVVTNGVFVTFTRWFVRSGATGSFYYIVMSLVLSSELWRDMTLPWSRSKRVPSSDWCCNLPRHTQRTTGCRLSLPLTIGVLRPWLGNEYLMLQPARTFSQ